LRSLRHHPDRKVLHKLLRSRFKGLLKNSFVPESFLGLLKPPEKRLQAGIGDHLPIKMIGKFPGCSRRPAYGVRSDD